MKLTEILRCPQIGNRLQFDDSDAIVRAKEMSFSIENGEIFGYLGPNESTKQS